MKVITKIATMRKYAARAKKAGKRIGLVPTMGYLHKGHMSLVAAARRECDVVVVSIFVNPIQFGPREDLKKYPRDLARDKKLCAGSGVDVLFVPSVREMYPHGFSTFVDVRGVAAETLCGASRPGHFRGVATVVAKLFNIVSPDVSYFGEKDAQQSVVIQKMARELGIPTRIRVMPTVREKNGLAVSSRNSYLSDEDRKKALSIRASLARARKAVLSGEHRASVVKNSVKDSLKKASGIRVDYVDIVRAEDLMPLKKLKGDLFILAAAFVGKTRLIDNIRMRI